MSKPNGYNADAITNPVDNAPFQNNDPIGGNGTAAPTTQLVRAYLIYQDNFGIAQSTQAITASLSGGGGGDATWNVELPTAPLANRRYLFCVRYHKMAGVVVQDRFIEVGTLT